MKDRIYIGIWVASFALVLGLIALIARVRNLFVNLREQVDRTWGDYQRVLLQRNDLTPQLLRLTDAYLTHEQRTFVETALARQQPVQAIPSGAGSSALNISRVFAVIESHPQLSADKTVNMIMQQLADTERALTEIAIIYNANVERYNSEINYFPYSLIAGWSSFERRDYLHERLGVATKSDGKA